MKDRFYAFLTHLALSTGVATVVVVMVFLRWYPAPLEEAVGVTQIFLLLLSVDIIMGPVLTLIVYKKGKPSLKFDLAIIALLQISALSYGIHTVFTGRPVFIVFNVDRFDVTRGIDIDAESAKTAAQEGNPAAVADWFAPRWVAAVAPADAKRQQEILFSATAGGADWPQLPELFVPLEHVKSEILTRAKSLQSLKALATKAEGVETLVDWNNSHIKWLPLRSTAKNMAVLVDADSAKIIKTVNINPWP
jgi:hypothetical protein